MSNSKVQKSRQFSFASSTVVQKFAEFNPNRLNQTIANESTQNLFIKKGTAATTTDYFVKILPGGYFEFPQPNIYEGIVTGVWDVVNGFARCSEDT